MMILLNLKFFGVCFQIQGKPGERPQLSIQPGFGKLTTNNLLKSRNIEKHPGPGDQNRSYQIYLGIYPYLLQINLQFQKLKKFQYDLNKNRHIIDRLWQVLDPQQQNFYYKFLRDISAGRTNFSPENE